jgi:type IV secretory pathway TraG/TraD family ATPase VirD4
MTQEKNNTVSLGWLMLGFGMLIFALDWMYTLEIVPFDGWLSAFVGMINKINVGNKIYIVRFFYVAALSSIIFISRGTDKETKTATFFIAPFSSVLFVLGYFDMYYYALYIYPIVFMAMLFTVPAFVRHFIGNMFATAKPIGVTKKEDGNISIRLKTAKGDHLSIFNPRLGIFIEGGAGSGKTVLIIMMLIEFIKKGYAGMMYDYEGDLTEDDESAGLLTRVAYDAIMTYDTPVKFAFLNFTALNKTVRCNPVSNKYIHDYNDCKSFAMTLMLNLNKEWCSKRDFWAENTISFVGAAIYYFNRNLPADMNTLPHIVDFLLRDFEMAALILSTDDEVAMYANNVIGPVKKKASGQVAGVQSSIQTYLSKLRSPEVYYVLSPPSNQEFDLDITNKENPYLLCLGNAPKKPGVYDAGIGAIIQVLKVKINQLDKYNKVIFMVDELPTQYIDKLDKVPAEMRKKGVATVLATQTKKQLDFAYGKDVSDIVYDNCGNVITGRTSVDTAKRMVETFGEYLKKDKTDSYSDHGTSYSVKDHYDKIIRTNDITNQAAGHFSGLIAGGEPPLFSTQFHYEKPPVRDIPNFNQDLKGKSQEEITVLIEKNKQDISHDIKCFMEAKNKEFDLDGSQAYAASIIAKIDKTAGVFAAKEEKAAQKLNNKKE